MPLEKRHSFLLGAIIVVLSLVVMFYERKTSTQKQENTQKINTIVNLYTARQAVLETKVQICNESYLNYLKESEKEVRELLFKTRELKNKIHEDSL